MGKVSLDMPRLRFYSGSTRYTRVKDVLDMPGSGSGLQFHASTWVNLPERNCCHREKFNGKALKKRSTWYWNFENWTNSCQVTFGLVKHKSDVNPVPFCLILPCIMQQVGLKILWSHRFRKQVLAWLRPNWSCVKVKELPKGRALCTGFGVATENTNHERFRSISHFSVHL